MSDPARFGLVFQFDPDTPGTTAQQATLRAAIEDWGFGTPRWRMLWYFAREYKARLDDLYGAGWGQRYVVVSINGFNANSWTHAMVLPSWATDRDLKMFFYHELGHVIDKFLLTTAARVDLMGVLPAPPHGDWTGFASTPHLEYWNRPAELWAWSFQRLCDSELPELEGGFTRDQMMKVLPNFDQAWVDAGLDIDDD